MEHHGTFGEDTFGRIAEHAINALGVAFQWDPYPFILLNLAFSTQAAYAAPLILLAQTRQAERDKVTSEKAERTHDEAERRSVARVAACARKPTGSSSCFSRTPS